MATTRIPVGANAAQPAASGLSMDYEVFLLSRIREEWTRSGDNSTAVASGLASAARVITVVAAIMACVFESDVAHRSGRCLTRPPLVSTGAAEGSRRR